MQQLKLLACAQRVLATVFLLAASGCFDSGVTWLPDSSGFVYTGVIETTQVRHYDLATRKLCVVVEDTKAPTYWPAVSPDGKQIAVARVVHSLDDKVRRIQIIRYDLNAKELHRSPALPWHTMDFKGGNPGDDRWEGTTSLFWSTQGDKLIVTDATEQIPRGIAIYDLAKERLIPVTGHLLVIGGSPMRRDGKMFLKWNYEGVFLVTMDGNEERIGTLEKNREPILRMDREAMTEWQGRTAVVAGATAQLQIDTAKRSVILTDTVPPRKNNAGYDIAAEYAFPENGAVVRALGGGHGLEILKPGAKEPHAVPNGGQYMFLPSPDQRWLVLRGISRGAKMLVIDRNGEIVAKLDSQ